MSEGKSASPGKVNSLSLPLISVVLPVSQIVNLLPPAINVGDRWPFYLSCLYLYQRSLSLINLRQRVPAAVPECNRQIALIEASVKLISEQPGTIDIKRKRVPETIAELVNAMSPPFPDILAPFHGYYPREYGDGSIMVSNKYTSAVEGIVEEMNKISVQLSPGLPSGLPTDVMALMYQKSLDDPTMQQAMLEMSHDTPPALSTAIRRETGLNLTSKQYLMGHSDPVISAIRHDNLVYLQQLLAKQRLNGYQMYCACMLDNLDEKTKDLIVERCSKFNIKTPEGESCVISTVFECINYGKYNGIPLLARMIEGKSEHMISIHYRVEVKTDVLARIEQILAPFNIAILKGVMRSRESPLSLTANDEKITDNIISRTKNNEFVMNFYELPMKKDALNKLAAALKELPPAYWNKTLGSELMGMTFNSEIMQRAIAFAPADIYRGIIRQIMDVDGSTELGGVDIFVAGIQVRGSEVVDQMIKYGYPKIAGVMLKLVAAGITTPELARAENKMYTYLLDNRPNIYLRRHYNKIFYQLLDHRALDSDEQGGRTDLFAPPLTRATIPVIVPDQSPILGLSSSPRQS